MQSFPQVLQVLLTREVHRAVQRQLEEWPVRDSPNGIYGIVANGGRALRARHTRFIRNPLLLERSGRQARKGT